MSRFAVAIEYLTGYAVATDPASRESPEWPPHPARVFMALAAAHFETHDSPENKRAERDALEWLAALDPPSLALPAQASGEFRSPRETLTVYVPVNDVTGIESLPSKRPRQPRTFPRVFVGAEPIRFIWSGDGQPSHLDALDRVCRKVTRIGHSSSLVWVRLERDATALVATHQPTDDSTEDSLRITGDGALPQLELAFNAENIQAYDGLDLRIRLAKSKQNKVAAKEEMAGRFPLGKPASRRPVFSISRGYRPVGVEAPAVPSAPFDPNLIVLCESEDSPQSFGLESTLLLTGALRGLIQSDCPVQPVPDWVSGHDGPDGPKLADGRGHIALLPLPFVQEWQRGREHYADGHIMGLAIALPRDTPARERAKALGPILFDKDNKPKPLQLKMGRAGVFVVQRDTRPSPPQRNLQSLTWTRPNRRWMSVTPVVLDRVPKTDRQKDRQAWNEEVARTISGSCTNQRLPEPLAIRVEKTPLVVGSLRAMPGQGGFPQYRPGSVQVHIEVEFPAPVQGPIVLGAGRFRGYGLCRPVLREGEP
jgi:CRISPR-associated protein Csb2